MLFFVFEGAEQGWGRFYLGMEGAAHDRPHTAADKGRGVVFFFLAAFEVIIGLSKSKDVSSNDDITPGPHSHTVATTTV